MLTPHIIRELDLTEDDLRPFRIPRGGVWHLRDRGHRPASAAASSATDVAVAGGPATSATRSTSAPSALRCSTRVAVAALDGLDLEHRALPFRGERGGDRAPCRIGCRGCRACGRAGCVGPVTMMRCGSQRNRSARIALSCSSAKRRSSYIQSWTQRAAARLRRQHGHEADDVARERRARGRW